MNLNRKFYGNLALLFLLLTFGTVRAQTIKVTLYPTSTSTWTVPTGVTRALVHCWGGGAGGSLSSTSTTANVTAIGGGGGAFAGGLITVSGTMNYVVGTGGAGRIGPSPLAGGNTSFNAGVSGNTILARGAGGKNGGGGVTSTGTVKWAGGDGFTKTGIDLSASRGGGSAGSLGNGGDAGASGTGAAGLGGGTSVGGYAQPGSSKGTNGGNGKILIYYPDITGLSASSGCGTAALTITGTNLTGAVASGVTIGGVAVSSITSNSGTVMVVVPAAGSSGTVSVTSTYGTFADATYSYTVNSNPSSGGTIATAQSGSSGLDPEAFTSSDAASGQVGTIEYIWQSSTSSNSDGFSDIASSNADTYDAGALTQTTWFKRLARVSCQSDWTGAAESNVIQVTISSCTPTSFTETITACDSYDWHGNTYTASNNTATWTGTNAEGCDSVVTLNLTITVLPLSPSASLEQPNCNAGGTITVSNVLSGSSYSIDGVNQSITGVFPNLLPGVYNLTEKNAAGCISAATSVTLNEPTGVPPAATLSVTHPTCASAYGTIRVTSTVFFNSFSINRTNFSNLTGVFSGLPAGTYNVWVKNAAGCISAPSTIEVNPQPATPSAPEVTITQPSCSVSTGTIEISSNLGDNLYYSTNSFTYLNITGLFSGVVSGSYNVTSKNAAGCISPATPVVINPRLTVPATPSAVVTQPTCALSTGAITVSSPSAAYTYSITRSGQTIGSINGFFAGVASGTYSLNAISASGCLSTSKSVVVNAQPATPAAPTLSVTQPTATVATGTIKVTSTVMGNRFSINGSGFTNLTGMFSGLSANTYNIAAKSSAGCISSPSTVSIGFGLSRGTETGVPEVVKPLSILPAAIASDLFEVGAYPNPSNTDFKLSISSASSETIRVTVFDMFGRALKYFSFASKPSITLGQDLKAGVYMVEVRQGKNMKSLKLVKF